MADPLSLGASLLAVASAAAAISKTLFKLADTLGNSNYEIRSIGKEVSAFARVVEDLYEFLEDAKELISQQAIANALDIMATCDATFAIIKRKLKFRAGKRANNFWQGVQWSFRREKVKPLCARLESYKSTLIMMISVIKLARCTKLMDNDDSSVVARKEQRSRKILENEIINTSVAISRWQQEEMTAELVDRGHMHFNHLQPTSTVPVMEIQWLAALVPYESPSLDPRFMHQGLARSPIFASKPVEPEQSRLDKAVDLLLSNWTTLNQPTGPKITDITSQASWSTKSHQTVKAAGQQDNKALSANKHSKSFSKANNDPARREKSKATAYKLQDYKEWKIPCPSPKGAALDSANIESADFSHFGSTSFQANSRDTAVVGVESFLPTISLDGMPPEQPSGGPHENNETTRPENSSRPESLLLDLSEPTEVAQDQAETPHTSEPSRTDLRKEKAKVKEEKHKTHHTSRVTFSRPDELPKLPIKSLLDLELSSDWGLGKPHDEIAPKSKQKNRKHAKSTPAPPSSVSVETTWPPYDPNPLHQINYPVSSGYYPPPPHVAQSSPFIAPYLPPIGPPSEINLSQYSIPPSNSQVDPYSQDSVQYHPQRHPLLYHQSPPSTYPQPPSLSAQPPLQSSFQTPEEGSPATLNQKPNGPSVSQSINLENDFEDTATVGPSENPANAKRDHIQKGNRDETGMRTVAGSTKSWSQSNEKYNFRKEAGSLKADNESSQTGDRKETRASATGTEVEEAWPRPKEKKEKKISEVYINVRDPIGRIFKFPYRLCLTWKDMQACIRDVFDNESSEAAEIRNPTQSGHYDLCDENDVIFPPILWESMIGAYDQSGLTIKLKPWNLIESKVQAAEATPTIELPSPKKEESVCTEMSQFDAEVEKPTGTQIDEESNMKSRDDPADPFIDDNLHWRYNFLYKFDEHDATFQRIWEREMKRSQAKAENTMLEILLGESNTKLKEIDAPLNINDGTQPSSSLTPVASARPCTSDNQESSNDHENDDPSQFVQKDDGDSTISQAGSDRGIISLARREPRDAPGDSMTFGEQQEASREQRRTVRSVELGASLRALEDANRRAENAVAKAESLEQRLNRLEKTGAGRSVHTPPDTPSVLSSPFAPPLSLASGAIQALRPPSIQKEESVKSRSISSFRKKFFRRQKSSSGQTS